MDMICKHHVNDNFSSILNNTRPWRLSYASFIDITCINKVNNNSSPILKNIWLLGPSHECSTNITYKNNVIDNFFLFWRIKGQKCEKQWFFSYFWILFNQLFFSLILNNIWSPEPDHESYIDMISKYNVNDNFH